MIQFDEHIFQMGWNHQLDRFGCNSIENDSHQNDFEDRQSHSHILPNYQTLEPTQVPIGPMYGIFTCIYHTNQLNVGIYAIHGFYGYLRCVFLSVIFPQATSPQANAFAHLGLVEWVPWSLGVCFVWGERRGDVVWFVAFERGDNLQRPREWYPFCFAA